MILLSVWYQATPEDEPQTHLIPNVEAHRAHDAALAYVGDLLALKGQGVRKFTIEVD